MSGGPSYHAGHWYEEGAIVLNYLRCLNGEIEWVRWEYREDGDGVDFTIGDSMGEHGFQAKHRSDPRFYWTIKKLSERGAKGRPSVLDYAAGWLDAKPERHYTLMTDREAPELANLITAAKGTRNADSWWVQVGSGRSNSGNPAITLMDHWKLDPTNSDDLLIAHDRLRRMSLKTRIEEHAKGHAASLAYSLCEEPQILQDALVRFAKEHITRQVDVDKIRRWLATEQIALIPRPADPASTAHFRDCTQRFIDAVADVRGPLVTIPRRQTGDIAKLLTTLPAGSVITVHGLAGSGKSEVLASVAQHLLAEHHLVWAFALDRVDVTQIPQTVFERDPLVILKRVAGSLRAVVIIDQIDVVVWSGTASRFLLRHLQELLHRARNLDITVIVGCRTVDRNNSQIARWLAAPADDAATDRVHSADHEIQIGDLDPQDAENVLKQHHVAPTDLDPAVLALVRRPLWMRLVVMLVQQRGLTQVTGLRSFTDVLRSYWDWIDEQVLNAGHAQSTARVLNRMDRFMSDHGILAMPKDECETGERPAVTQLISLGVIAEEADERGARLRFTHQTLIEYRLAQEWCRGATNETDLRAKLPPRQDQDLRIAHRLRLAVPLLIDRPSLLMALGTLMQGEHLRPLVRVGVYRAVAALDSEHDLDLVGPLVRSWLDDDKRRWRVMAQVVRGNPRWVAWLSREKWIDQAWVNWDESDRDNLLLRILATVSQSWGDGVAHHLGEWSKQDPTVLDRADILFMHEPGKDTDALFEVRLQKMLREPATRVMFTKWESFLDEHPVRAARMLGVLLPKIDPIRQMPDGVLPPLPENIPNVRRAGITFVQPLLPWWRALTVEQESYWSRDHDFRWVQVATLMADATAHALSNGEVTLATIRTWLPQPLRWQDHLLLLRVGTRIDAMVDARARHDLTSWFAATPSAWIARPMATQSPWAEAQEFLRQIAPGLSDDDRCLIENALCTMPDPWNDGEEDDAGATPYHLLPCLPSLSEPGKKILTELSRRFDGRNDWGVIRRAVPMIGYGAAALPQAKALVLSVDDWLATITRIQKQPGKWTGQRDEQGSFVEETPERLARQLYRLASRYPRRFLDLARRLDGSHPIDVRISLLSALLADRRNATEPELNLTNPEIEDLIAMPTYHELDEARADIALAIHQRADHPWNDDTVARLITWCAPGKTLPTYEEPRDDQASAWLTNAPLTALHALAKIAEHHESRRPQVWTVARSLADCQEPNWAIAATCAAWRCRSLDLKIAAELILSWSTDSRVAAQNDITRKLFDLIRELRALPNLTQRLVQRLTSLGTATTDARWVQESGGNALLWLRALDLIDDESLTTLPERSDAYVVAFANALATYLHEPETPTWALTNALYCADHQSEAVQQAIAWTFRDADADHLIDDPARFATAFVKTKAFKMNPEHFLSACDRRTCLAPLAQHLHQAAMAIKTARHSWTHDHLVTLIPRLLEDAERTEDLHARQLALDAWDELIEYGSPDAAERVIGAAGQGTIDTQPSDRKL